ncbi:MAG: alkaline phosphatase family protein [Candidatus Binatia bacterium]
MKPFAFVLALFLFLSSGCAGEPDDVDTACVTIAWPASLPVYDHVVIVVEENKDYSLIIGADEVAPYINGTLRAEGANFTRAYGEEHHSQGNYFWLFSGSNHGVGFNDEEVWLAPNYPFTSSNLGEQLIDKGHSFKGYAQSLPVIGDTVWTVGPGPTYGRKHVPWISFTNVPNGTTVETSSNLRFQDFPADSSGFNDLPTVAFVIPDLDHDMHNGDPPQSITTGDTWLKDNIDAYYQWAKDNNSLLIFTFDENSDVEVDTGLTNPASADTSLKNQIATIFAGDHIKPGGYTEGNGITHVNILRTLEAMYGLCKSGAQQPFAAQVGITDDYIITDVFDTSR